MSGRIPRGPHRVDEELDLEWLDRYRREQPKYCTCGPAHIPDRTYRAGGEPWVLCRRCGHLKRAVTEDWPRQET